MDSSKVVLLATSTGSENELKLDESKTYSDIYTPHLQTTIPELDLDTSVMRMGLSRI